MNGPAKTRPHDSETGWLSMLVETGLAPRQQAEAAQARAMREELDRIRAITFGGCAPAQAFVVGTLDSDSFVEE